MLIIKAFRGLLRNYSSINLTHILEKLAENIHLTMVRKNIGKYGCVV